MEVVQFFFERYQRAVQMDMANKINGKPTHFWITAEEWIEAYKQSLSKNKQNQFDKEWRRLEQELQKARNQADGYKK